MCKLCDKIYKTLEEMKQEYRHDWNESICIIRNELYVPCFDPYYSGVVLKMNYCPICGRKLGENNE